MTFKPLLLVLYFLFSYISSANIENNYPVLLDKKIELSGELYKLPHNQLVSIKNNWLDKTATISIFDSLLSKRSLILNNTEIRDLYVEHTLITAIANSKKRAFITKFDSLFSIQKIFLLDTNSNPNDIFVIHHSSNNNFIISKNNEIYFYDTSKKLKQNISNQYIENSFLLLDTNRFLYLRSSENITYLVENTNHRYEKELIRIEPANDYSIRSLNGKLIVECHYETNSHIFIYSSKLKLIKEFWIDVSRHNYLIKSKNKKELSIYQMSYSGGNYTIKYVDYNSNIINQIQLPNYIISPLIIKSDGNSITAVFQNAIYNFDENLNINYYKPISIPTNESESEVVIINNKDYIALGTKTTRVYTKTDNPFWQVNYYFQKVITYIIPIILLILILILYYKFIKKRELNETLLDLSDNDFIFVFNKKGDLININKTAMKIVEIDSSVPLGRFFKYYCISNHTIELFEIFAKMKNLKDSFQQKIHIYHNEELHEYICNAVTKRRPTGSIAGYILSGTDITEELRQQKMNNFAQLAHDMQTNLSTLKLNAEELTADDDISKSKKLKIIKQVNILNQKVRDIVTVGRSSSVHKAKHKAQVIIDEVIEEFDSEFYPNIVFANECNDFELYVDKQKLSRAIRNAAENSLKSMKDKVDGRLILRAHKNTKYAYFEVQDNGRGMNKEVKENMLKPYYTSAGGTGLGTMIMRNAIEQHGGEIIVESEEGKGTKISFKIPLS